MARAEGFDLARALAQKGFTPGRGDAEGLVALVVAGEEPSAARAAVGLAGLGAVGRDAAIAQLEGEATLDEGARARLVSALGLCARAGDGDALHALVARTRDAVARVRRAAVVALGKVGGDAARDALVARWDAGDAPPDEQRALAEALGKVGGDAARARLAALVVPSGVGADRELARRRDRAILMADRSAQRDDESSIAVDRAPPAALRVRLGCRPGLGAVLLDELRALDMAPEARGDAAALVTLAEPWRALFASRLWASAAIEVPLGGARTAVPDALAEAVARAILAPPIRSLMRAWTVGAIRWRLGFASGHKRAVVWRVARDVTAAAPELVNDPTATTWDLRVDDDAWRIDVVPRRAPDPRFAYRGADVPAASHPSVAAALAWIGAPRAGERVWDPFCGSGLELVECALRARSAALIGTDLDEAALAAARTNCAAAQVAAHLAHGDARHAAPPGGKVDLVVTNPPLGSRVQIDAAALLVEALPNLARHLAPAGRLVWITPSARRTGPAALALGLARSTALSVDLGGVRGTLEVWRRA